MKSLKIFSTLFGLAGMAILSSCDSVIYEPEGDCEPVHRILFTYDHNLKFADAFPAEVPSVNLYIFDQAGNLVRTISEDVPTERAKDFAIELRDIPAGKYDLLAWCGVKDSEHFTVNHTAETDPKFEHHTCRIEREIDAFASHHIRNDIGRLYHGTLMNVDMTQDEGTYEHTVELMKNTNVVRVVLQHMSGSPIDKDDFEFTITEQNGLMASTNHIIPDNQITYHPWMQRSGTASINTTKADNGESGSNSGSVSAVVTEFTLGRLMAGSKAVLNVNSTNDGHTILSVPVTDYALLVKGHYYEPGSHREMSDQEYLDRQDEYPMTFFLDESNEWINSVIYINSWRVVINDIDNMH